MNPFLSLRDYEEFVYTLQAKFPSIQGSSLVVVRSGKLVARLQGQLMFAGYTLTINERLSQEDSGVVIETYGYELWQGEGKLYWYDSQPHPNDPTLASTHPHHKHVPPDLKHHRIPAPQLSFTRPNLPSLIEEIEELLR